MKSGAQFFYCAKCLGTFVADNEVFGAENA